MYTEEREKLIDTYRETLIQQCPFMTEPALKMSIAAFSTGLDLAFACYQDDVDTVVESFKAMAQDVTILN